MIFGDRKIIYHLEVTKRALTMHWRVILIILLLRRSMKSFSSRQKCTGHSVIVIKPHLVAITISDNKIED